MKALIDKYNRIFDIVEKDKTFEVHPDLKWVDAPKEATNAWSYDPEVGFTPPPEPEPVDVAREARNKRDALLSQSDWVTIRAKDTGDPVPTEWQTYRQALRDITEQTGFPENIEWPEKPES